MTLTKNSRSFHVTHNYHVLFVPWHVWHCISWNLTKTPQNFVQDSFTIKLTKAYTKKASGSKLHSFLNVKKKDKMEIEVIKKNTN